MFCFPLTTILIMSAHCVVFVTYAHQQQYYRVLPVEDVDVVVVVPTTVTTTIASYDRKQQQIDAIRHNTFFCRTTTEKTTQNISGSVVREKVDGLLKKSKNFKIPKEKDENDINNDTKQHISDMYVPLEKKNNVTLLVDIMINQLDEENECKALKENNVSSHHSRRNSSAFKKTLGNWMGNLPQWFRNEKTLRNMTVMGTHDSGAYRLIHRIDPGNFKHTAFLPDTLMSHSLFCKFALAQSIDIYQQMEAGARYLDVRTAYDPVSEIFRTQHMLYGIPIVNILNQVGRFLDKYSSEIVIIALSHVHGPKGKNSYPHEKFEELIEYAKTIFSGMLIGKDGFETPLQTLMTKNRRVIVLVDGPSFPYDDLIWDMRSNVGGKYANTYHLETLLDKANTKLEDYKEWDKHPENQSKLWRTFWTLTATPEFIVKQTSKVHKWTRKKKTLYDLATLANSNLGQWIEQIDVFSPNRTSNVSTPLLGNVFMVDYIEDIEADTILKIISQENTEIFKVLKDN